MRLGYFAPRVPARSGVAEYAEALAAALSPGGEVRWGESGDLTLYQIGNNRLHWADYQRALRHAGVVLLHDAVLHHLLLSEMDRAAYVAEFIHNYGEWSAGLAGEFYDRRAFGDVRLFDYPMLRRLCEGQRMIVVHNAGAARRVKEHAPGVRVEVVPHLAQAASRSAAPEFDFGVFGYFRESKRLGAVREALATMPQARLLLSGDFVSADYERSMAPLLADSRVTHLPHCGRREFAARAGSVKVCVNLKWPVAGETSGITMQTMGLGVPTIVTDGEEVAGVPESACARVDAGVAERPMLAAMMQWLLCSPRDRTAMGDAAREHIAREHDPSRVAETLWTLLRTVAMVMVACCLRAEVKLESRVPMRDNVRLATNVFLPAANGRFPTLLARTPYGKGTVLPPAYRGFVERGYAVVLQDVRGMYDSDGIFTPLTQETPDAEDTLSWIARQAWSNGRVGMIGGSYLGMAQWKAALTQHPALRAIFPVHAGIDEYFDRFYSRGGAFRLGHRVLWIAENLKAPRFLVPPFESWTWHMPLRTIDQRAAGQTVRLLQAALDHPVYDAYWQASSVRTQLSRLRVPAYAVGGWYDPNVESDLETIAALRKLSAGDRAAAWRIAVGPWAHNMAVPFPGVDYGPEAGFPVRREQLEWFDRWLNGKAGSEDDAPFRLFVMGANRWQDEWDWPPKRMTAVRYFLQGSRGLSTQMHARDETLEFLYDPARPVPTRGGQTCCNPSVWAWGPMDQRPVEERADVISFTTAPLKSDVEVIGPVKAHLWVSTTAPDTDFTAKLVDVLPTGEARNLCDGILRLRYREGLDRVAAAMTPGVTVPIVIDVGVTANVFRAGHQIRVEISSSNFPKYDRNPNTGRAVAEEREGRVARQTIHLGRRFPSHILLPAATGLRPTSKIAIVKSAGAVAKW